MQAAVISSPEIRLTGIELSLIVSDGGATGRRKDQALKEADHGTDLAHAEKR